ncbi:FISUMP domain-containing protein [Chitinophaga sp. GCM10012297]|uniref:Fibrobacter succinogenes major paralogous domain-containing protein n=1 Tax=Chitinophaga chungangae TaxID=2821488 RepID=A0ABS3YGE6_9BACT|nr:FISUMP domain-containing protein [Chitinophaga chungangae]MBO9153749.1 hypothetical protein [Chitinophaga chungangae]
MRYFILMFLIAQNIASAQQPIVLKDRDGTVYQLKVMPDNLLWMTRNLATQTKDSWCFNDSISYCMQYGRLYTWQAAQEACAMLGEGWRLPSNEEWQRMVKHFGGVRDDSQDGGKAAFVALMPGGKSGFDIILGGNREADGKSYARMNRHGFYWTSTSTGDGTAWLYNFGKGGRIVNRHSDADKQEGFSARCVKNVAN